VRKAGECSCCNRREDGLTRREDDSRELRDMDKEGDQMIDTEERMEAHG
jgi:hypothetical protein